MIVTFANTKGGVAKTTSAMLTALALTRQGEHVEVWDADAQGSATDWYMTAKDSAKPLPFIVRSVNLAMLKRANVAAGTIVLVDTPPGDPRIIDAAAHISDLVVIPTDSSSMDVVRTVETYNALSGVPRAVLVVKAEGRTKLLRELVTSLDEAEIARFPTMIPKRQEIKDASGGVPNDVDAYEAFSLELKEAAR